MPETAPPNPWQRYLIALEHRPPLKQEVQGWMNWYNQVRRINLWDNNPLNR